MAWRVHGQQHVAHLRQAGRVEVLDDHSAFMRREDLGVFGYVHHVGVAQDCPVAGLVVHLLEYDGRLAAQTCEQVVWWPIDVGL